MASYDGYGLRDINKNLIRFYYPFGELNFPETCGIAVSEIVINRDVEVGDFSLLDLILESIIIINEPISPQLNNVVLPWLGRCGLNDPIECESGIKRSIVEAVKSEHRKNNCI